MAAEAFREVVFLRGIMFEDGPSVVS